MSDHAQKESDHKVRIGSKAAGEGAAKICWDDSQMSSSYANVVNATSNREEVTLFFGTNRTWNATDIENVVVNLSNRIILNPHAAKRLLTLLAAVLAEYERRFGKINITSKLDHPPGN